MEILMLGRLKLCGLATGTTSLVLRLGVLMVVIEEYCLLRCHSI
jgi:hypothetical protein